jgi:hypothetical protein
VRNEPDEAPGRGASCSFQATGLRPGPSQPVQACRRWASGDPIHRADGNHGETDLCLQLGIGSVIGDLTLCAAEAEQAAGARPAAPAVRRRRSHGCQALPSFSTAHGGSLFACERPKASARQTEGRAGLAALRRIAPNRRTLTVKDRGKPPSNLVN